MSNGLSFLKNRRLSNGYKTNRSSHTTQSSAPSSKKGAGECQSSAHISKASTPTITTEKMMANISVNTDRCKRRFAPPATAGYFNR